MYSLTAGKLKRSSYTSAKIRKLLMLKLLCHDEPVTQDFWNGEHFFFNFITQTMQRLWRKRNKIFNIPERKYFAHWIKLYRLIFSLTRVNGVKYFVHDIAQGYLYCFQSYRHNSLVDVDFIYKCYLRYSCIVIE